MLHDCDRVVYFDYSLKFRFETPTICLFSASDRRHRARFTHTLQCARAKAIINHGSCFISVSVVSVGLSVQLLWDRFECRKHVRVKTAESKFIRSFILNVNRRVLQ